MRNCYCGKSSLACEGDTPFVEGEWTHSASMCVVQPDVPALLRMVEDMRASLNTAGERIDAQRARAEVAEKRLEQLDVALTPAVYINGLSMKVHRLQGERDGAIARAEQAEGRLATLRERILEAMPQ